ncbi:MAG: DUF11 domain-containing protein, partial [Anaerolineae bacterium]|nr:DUF11 domain-containing protein [Anaerolineae bacterium]
AQLTAWQQRSYTITFTVPPDPLLLGTDLITTAAVTSVALDGNLANNTATNTRTITGSYDPNDKLAQTSLGSSSAWIIDEDGWIDYTIRFQNTGTDTAFNILITDTLPANLDPATIQMGAGSHAFTWELRDQGTLKFYFQNILLPDSNFNEPLSHGFVCFRIRPRLPLLPGDEITNIANIYFDFNPPVITEPSVLVATINTGIVTTVSQEPKIYPNPAIDQLFIQWPEDQPGRMHWRIQAPDGRGVREGRLGSGENTIPLGDLAAGTYMLLLDSANGRSIHRFIRSSRP